MENARKRRTPRLRRGVVAGMLPEIPQQTPCERLQSCTTGWLGDLTFCNTASIVKTGWEHRQASVLKCRAWTCELCAPTRRKGVICEVAAGHPDRLLTLTMKPSELRTPAEQAAYMSERFRRLIKLMRDRYPNTVWAYFCVFEAHKSGWPHLHVAMRGRFVPWAWLRDQWCDLTGSTGVDIRMIPDAKRAGSYIAKYLGKDLHKFGTCKRYWCSKAWRIDPKWVKSSDPRFFRSGRVEYRSTQDLATDWSRCFPDVWWEGMVVVAGPRAPPDVLRMRRAFDALT